MSTSLEKPKSMIEEDEDLLEKYDDEDAEGLTTKEDVDSVEYQAAMAAKALELFGSRHSFKIKGHRFVVDKRYSPKKSLGAGAYGVVCAAEDTLTGGPVAIKKVTRAFADLIDAKRVLREIKMLGHFDHPNIIKMVDMVNPFNKTEFEDVYLIMDLMETDLHRIIHSKNKLTEQHLQYFIYQLLCGCKYMHSCGIIHRDLKPSNLLVNQDCSLKICDFGLARGFGDLDEMTNDAADKDLTEYVVTRWYRAPEIMCSCQEYDQAIDVWSVGCILGELLARKPLFPGDNYIHQLDLIFGLLGTPSDEDLEWMTNSRACEYIQSLDSQKKVPLKKIFKNASKNALDLLDKMLVFNPAKRMTVDEALEHPFFAEIRKPELESNSTVKFDFSFEYSAGSKEDLQKCMFEEVCKYRPEAVYASPFKNGKMIG